MKIFADTFAEFPKATAKITGDLDVLLAFFDYPFDHWIHLRTTNPIESTFSTVRLRTKVTRGAGSRNAGLAMAYKLLDAAQARWRMVAGCIGGAVLANLMFAVPAVSISVKDRATPAHFLSEVIATLGLILVIFALARSGRSRSAPAAVGAYIGAAYFFTSSTSFANPAITIGRIFSDTFAGIAPSSVPSSSPRRSSAAFSRPGSSRRCIPVSHRRRPPASSSPTTAARRSGHLPAQRTTAHRRPRTVRPVRSSPG